MENEPYAVKGWSRNPLWIIRYVFTGRNADIYSMCKLFKFKCIKKALPCFFCALSRMNPVNTYSNIDFLNYLLQVHIPSKDQIRIEH